MTTPRRTLILLIAVSALLRLAWASSLGPGVDEAYHYLFTVHRDWSYFDHPPMLALVESIGPALIGGKATTFGLRLGFIALFAGSTWLMYRLGERTFGPRVGLLGAFALNVSAYHTAAASTFALPDGPLLFFWLLTLNQLVAAFAEPARVVPWIGVGLAWGCAMLSKYHAIFLPAGALLYVAVEPAARRVLRQPGPYLAAVIGLVAFSPVIAWNAEHEWASFLFQGGRAVGGFWPRPDFLVSAIWGQAAYLFPWIWLVLVMILVRGLRRFRQAGPADRFLLCQAILPLAVFTAVACFRRVLPHWTLVGFLSLMPILGQVWVERWRADPAGTRRRLAILGALPIVIAAFMAAEYRTGFLQQGGRGTLGLVSPKIDPTVDMYGWDQVADQLKRRGLLDRKDVFLFTGSWYLSGALAFATRDSGLPVLCYNHHDARSFAFWSRPEDWVGRDGLLISVNGRESEPECYDRFFSRIEPAASFDIFRAGGTVRSIRVFRCIRQTVAFPFVPGEPDPGARAVASAPGRDEAKAPR